MTRLEKKLRATLRRLSVGKEAKVLVAVSGGADSVALLDAFVRLRRAAQMPKTIFAVHCNHLLRGDESDADEMFVRELAMQLQVPLFVGSFNAALLAEEMSRNLEATARDLRYSEFQAAATQFGANVIATAHTRDDQVETLLMRLLRGSGAEGWRGIHESFALDSEAVLIRPLLEVTRAEVIAHCERYKLSFRTDSSNLITDFTRNRVRHELLPQLKTYNPRIDEALLRLSRQMTEDDDYLNGIAAESLQKKRFTQRRRERGEEESEAEQIRDDSLEVKCLRDEHPAIRRRVLRLWLRRGRGDLRRIDAAHLLSLDKLVTQGEGGSYVELPGGWQVWRRRRHLVLVKAGSETVESDALQAGQKEHLTFTRDD
ncbi:MAG: tRNA lysidine(34) synthetase TilS [Blastocatellia bacterium]